MAICILSFLILQWICCVLGFSYLIYILIEDRKRQPEPVKITPRVQYIVNTENGDEVVLEAEHYIASDGNKTIIHIENKKYYVALVRYFPEQLLQKVYLIR